MTLPPALRRFLRVAAYAALPLLKEAALMGLERWARRSRERSSEEDFLPWSGHEEPLPLALPLADWSEDDDFLTEGEDLSRRPDRITTHVVSADDPKARITAIKREGGYAGSSFHIGGTLSFAGKVAEADNLKRAWQRVRRRSKSTPGSDQQTVSAFGTDADRELLILSRELITKAYRPRPLRCFLKRKSDGRKREIGIPTVRDRVAQTAMRQILDLSVEDILSPWSFAYRSGSGCHRALDEVDRLLRAGNRWIVRADVADCFDRIPHGPLLDDLRHRAGFADDESLVQLIGAVITSPKQLGKRLSFPRRGVPQGSPLSPLLANFYLDPVDRSLREGGFHALRYADDIVIACRDHQGAKDALALLNENLEARELSLNQSKSGTFPADGEEGFEFLGHLYQEGSWSPLPDRIEKMKGRVAVHLKEGGAMAKQKAERVVKGWHAFYRTRGGVEAERATQWAEEESGKF